MKKFSLGKIFSSNLAILIIALLLSVVFWFIAKYNLSDDVTVVIRDVPVVFDESGPLYTQYSLTVAEESNNQTVDIYVTGQTKVIGGLTKDDFIITTAAEGNISGPGEYKFKVVASKKDTFLSYQIDSVSPQTITVRLEKVVTEELPIEADISNISVADGYVLGTTTVSPSSIILQGTEAELERVVKCIVKLPNTDNATEKIEYTGEIILLDAENNTISTKNIRKNVDEAEVTVNVLYKASVDLVVNFINVPDGYDISSLSYTLSNSKIEIAGPKESVENLNELSIGYIDMLQFNPNKDYNFEIKLPAGYVNQSSFTEVNVNFSESNLATRYINVTNISLINAPANYNITNLTPRINGVLLIGPADEIYNISSTDVVAQVDLSEITPANNTFSIVPKFVITSNQKVWVTSYLGGYVVSVRLTAKAS